MIDLLAFLALVAFVAFGWTRGVKGMALWSLSLVAGSLAATFLARPAGTWLAGQADLPLLVAIPVAGMLVAGVATGVARGASLRVGRERKVMLDGGWEPPPWDRWGGAALGGACGAGVVLFGAWVGTATGNLHGREAQIRASTVGRAAARVGEPVVRVVAGEALGNAVMASTAAYLMSDPERARETVGALVKDERVRQLATDPGVRQALVAGNAGALSRVPALRDLAADPAFVAAARRVRLAPGGEGDTLSPQELAEAVAERLGPLAHAVEALSKNPDVQAALRDPAFKEALARGDLAALISQGRLDEILRQVSAELERIR